MATIKPIFAAATALGLLAVCLAARGGAQPPPPLRTRVVELFTSQGCSSCPPADTLLGELAGLPNMVAVAFHVDYWDSIGWRDRYAIPAAVVRQRRYVETLGLSTAFTPQVVIDGRDSFVGSDRQRILAALTTDRETIPVAAEVAHGELIVTLPERAQHNRFDVGLIAYLPEATTAIGRGENSGRTLAEFNIAREFRHIGSWRGEAKVIRVPLESFPADATRVAVLVQDAEQGPIAGSAVASIR